MGGCFGLPDRAAEDPVNGQPQQPGGATRMAKSLCQSIYDFFMECLFSNQCVARFGDEPEEITFPPTRLLSEAEGEEEEPIRTQQGKSYLFGEIETSVKKNRTNARVFLYATVAAKENRQEASALNPNARTGADGNEVAGTGADGSVLVGTVTDDSVVAGTDTDDSVVAETDTDDSVVAGTEADGSVVAKTGTDYNVAAAFDADGSVVAGTEMLMVHL